MRVLVWLMCWISLIYHLLLQPAKVPVSNDKTMKSNTLAILILAYCILVACTRTSPNAQLVQADSLMQKFPDSALRFLQKIRPEELNSLEDRAYHALLLTEVKDKNFIQQTEDSQIRIAVQYYDSIKDIPMQAKSYYYWGCIRRDQNNHPEALKKFFTAITHAQSISDNKLAGYIYSNIANLYLLQRLNEQADSIYQITERLAIQEKDSNLLADVLSQRGMIDINRGKEYYSEAEQKILLAFKISRHIAQRNLMAKTAYSLSLLYGRMNMGKEAVEFAKLSLNNQDNVKMLYRGYLLLGDAYYKTVQYDSALIYLNKALYSSLDSSRFKYFLSQALGCNANEVEGMVIGGHGDTTMIPLARLATYKGQPVSTLLSEEKLNEVVASTMVGGATLTKLLGTSAWYAPGAAGAYVVVYH